MSYDIDFDFDRLSQQDLLTYDILDVSYYDIGQLKDNIHDTLRFLNYYDLDLIYLTYLAKKKQVDLAKILDQTQPSVSYNLSRIRKQIQFVYFFLANIDIIVNYLRKTEDFTLFEKQVLLVFFYSLTSAKAAVIFKMHPITFKNRLMSILQKLSKSSPQIYSIFMFVFNNENKIKKTPFIENKRQKVRSEKNKK